MYAPYLPSSASEFPNDNPELHEGARWVCTLPVGPAKAVLRASAALTRALSARPEPTKPTESPESPESQWRPVLPPVRCLEPVVARGAPLAANDSLAGPVPREPFRLEPGASAPAPPATATVPAPASATPASATPLPPGPLELDLSRIVLPHRVADVPPPPAFIFRPLPSSRRAAAALALAQATPPLTPLGYQVIDQRDASCRVQRRWRVDVAPCLAVAAELNVSAASALPSVVAAELTLVAVPAPDAPPMPEPLPEQGPASGLRRKPASESPPEASSKKQRRRAVRVASSASLMTAALPGNAELSRTLSALDADFAERRIEQPASGRKRRGRRGSGSGSARARRAANAV